MTKITEAVFIGGVLKPKDELGLHEAQRVRIIVEPIPPPEATPDEDRAATIARWKAGIAKMNFKLTGPLPTRDELHDRF